MEYDKNQTPKRTALCDSEEKQAARSVLADCLIIKPLLSTRPISGNAPQFSLSFVELVCIYGVMSNHNHPLHHQLIFEIAILLPHSHSPQSTTEPHSGLHLLLL